MTLCRKQNEETREITCHMTFYHCMVPFYRSCSAWSYLLMHRQMEQEKMLPLDFMCTQLCVGCTLPPEPLLRLMNLCWSNCLRAALASISHGHGSNLHEWRIWKLLHVVKHTISLCMPRERVFGTSSVCHKCYQVSPVRCPYFNISPVLPSVLS